MLQAVHFPIKVLLIIGAVAASPHLRIPFKDGHESKFVFSLEQYDKDQLLECTGDLYVKNLTDRLVFSFRGVDIHRNINKKVSDVKVAVGSPIVLKVSSTKISDPDGYGQWPYVDPRIIVKMMKYTNINDKGNLNEKSWELGVRERCAPKITLTQGALHTSKMVAAYDFDGCVDLNDDEIIKEHHRAIKFTLDNEKKYITEIDYNYRRKTTEYDLQNTAQITFKEFVRY